MNENRKIPKRYRTDIPAIIEKWGDLTEGKIIETTLEEIFGVCEREYRKVISYYGLVNYLKREYDVTMTIVSQKQKQTPSQ